MDSRCWDRSAFVCICAERRARCSEMHLRFVSVRLLLVVAAAMIIHRVFHRRSLIILWTYHGLSSTLIQYEKHGLCSCAVRLRFRSLNASAIFFIVKQLAAFSLFFFLSILLDILHHIIIVLIDDSVTYTLYASTNLITLLLLGAREYALHNCVFTFTNVYWIIIIILIDNLKST